MPFLSICENVSKVQLCFSLVVLLSGCWVRNSSAVPVNETSAATPLPATPLTTTVTAPLVTSPPPSLSSNTSAVVTNTTHNGTDLLASPPLLPTKPPPALGLPCNTTSECKANFSECTKNICSCKSGYFASKESLRCLHVVSKLGEECSEDEQCTEGLNKHVGPSTCLNFICSCAIGMSLVQGKCQGPTVLNEKCSTDEDCTIKRSSCTEGMCTCLSGFVPNSDNNACLPVNFQLQKLSGPAGSGGCSEDIQCQNAMGDLSICVIGADGGTCQCQPGTHVVNNQCMKFKDLGASCSYNEECISADINSETESSRICNQGKCGCDKGAGWIQRGDVCTGGGSQNSVASVLVALITTFWMVVRH